MNSITDITELALIAKIKKQLKNFDTVVLKVAEANALVEALEKAQDTINDMDNRIRKQNRHVCELFDDNTALRQRIAELESRTVTVKLPRPGFVTISGERMAVYLRSDVDAILSAAGIKVGAE